MEKIRILTADDHEVFRMGLCELLAKLPDMDCVGESATGGDAIEKAKLIQPDVVLMDISMPGVNGIEATRQILRTSPHIRVVMLTMAVDNDSVFAAIRAGARGYVLKGSDKDEIERAVHAVMNGESLLSPAIAKRMIDYFARQPTEPIFPELTDREREVLELVAQGRNNTEIAKRLSISDKTVRNHVSNIFSKLQVADRAQAIIRAREAGLGLI